MAVYNHLLFSELFFRQIRRNTDDLDNLRATLGTIRDTWQYYLPSPENTAAHIWQPAAPIDKNDVHQLRSSFIEPVFGYLELVYAPCDADDRAFFLYGDWEQKNRTGLCLVLPYSAQIEGRDPVTTRIPKGRNYAQQLQKLLYAHDLEWGVLTNGRFWRLYHRSELSPTDTYLQVDLGNVISTENIHDYIVFHRFFSRPAFVQENGRQRLDIYKEQSDKATQQIEDHLSTHVEEIVRYLSQGLVESCQANQEDITSRDTRTAIYQNALFLVYRLLFALYAEARDLLPLDNPTYANVCLRSLLQQVNHNHTNGFSYDDDYAMWDHLQALFALIDQGDADAEVPAYNGGLFDPGRRPFLTKHRIRNTFLQAALLRLAYLPAKGKTYDQDRRPLLIDYRDLSVRHLGSLYEGLLEYNLFVVRDEPRVVRATKKTTRYVPYSKAGKVRSTETVLQIGEVYFSETEGERKATGSYYTPEDVVAYIVRNTVGEVLQDRQQRFLEDQAIQQQLKDLADTPADIPAYAQIQRALDEQFLRFVNRQILDLKVLDPAMGSGHFLVNVTHNIANFIVEFLNETDWENPGIDTDVAYWKRLVAERCIFGVDLNELAVELAKLCLWMTTTAKGKPLTFVDHHLSHGNSLIGTWLDNVGIYPFVKKESEKAFTLPLDRYQLDMEEVLSIYQELYAKNQNDVSEVREKARLFDEEIKPRLQRYRELMTLHTDIYYGNGVTEDLYSQLGAAVSDKKNWAWLKETRLNSLLAKNADLYHFHWEIEFPEVFFQSNHGFDVVVGNPPYIRQERLSKNKTFLENAYSDVFSGSADLYVFFLVRGAEVLNAKGVLGFIVSNKWLRANYADGLRKYLKEKVRLKKLLDFGHSDVFKNTDTFPCIIFFEKSPAATSEETFFYCDVSDHARKSRTFESQIRLSGFDVPLANLSPEFWLLEPKEVATLMQKLNETHAKLRDHVKRGILNGIKTGLNEAFCVDTQTKERILRTDENSTAIIRKLLRGRNIERWKPKWGEEWIIVIPSSTNQSWPWSNRELPEAEAIFKKEFPGVYQHLSPYRERLMKRTDQGQYWWELRSCDYYETFEEQKILIQGIIYHSTFSMDSEFYLLNSCYFIPTDSKFLLAVLTSRLMWWYAFRVLPHMKDEALHPHTAMVLDFPIPEIDDSEILSEINTLVDKAISLADSNTIQSKNELLQVEHALNTLVMKVYKLTDEEIRLVQQTLPMRDPIQVLKKRVGI